VPWQLPSRRQERLGGRRACYGVVQGDLYEINKRSECHQKSLTDHGNVFKLGVSMLDAVTDSSQASRSRFVLISDECGTSFRIKNDLTLYLPGRKF